MTRQTDIEAGDIFIFRGLTGMDLGEPEMRLEVRYITVDGNLILTVHSQEPAPPYATVAYATAVMLVEQGIWEGPMRSRG